MNDKQISSIRTRATRNSDGRKVDVWHVSLPDSKSRIDVMLHSSNDEIRFEAIPEHVALKGFRWSDSDLANLRKIVMEDVERTAKEYFETDWRPVVSLNASLDRKDSNSESGISFSLDLNDLYMDSSRAVGNRGETRVLQNQVSSILLQKSYDEIDDEDIPGFNNTRTSCVVLDAEQRDKVASLVDLFELFSISLMRRLSPDVVRLSGLPSPDDIGLIMQEVIDNHAIPEIS